MAKKQEQKPESVEAKQPQVAREKTPAEKRKELLEARLRNSCRFGGTYYPVATLTKFRLELKAIQNETWWPRGAKGPGDPGWRPPPIRGENQKLFDYITGR